jgi:DNA-binding HxlR family transcriptional regulator/putative sterol carrier protein
MPARTYGQYCGFARAVEVVGERWAFLIIRDLLVGPKRFTDLQRGLPGIPTNILTARLKELEEAGVIRRRLLPRPERGVAYELTEYGMELEETVFALGRWGAKSLAEPREGETVTPDSLVMALRTTFQPEAARKSRLAYELRFGDIVLHARIHNGTLEAGQGAIENPDLIIETGPALKALMAGEIAPAQAIASGGARITGDPKLFDRFVEMFHIDSMPLVKEST